MSRPVRTVTPVVADLLTELLAADMEHQRALEAAREASRRRSEVAARARKAGATVAAVAGVLGVSRPVALEISRRAEGLSSDELRVDTPELGRGRESTSPRRIAVDEGSTCVRGGCAEPADTGRFCRRHAWS